MEQEEEEVVSNQVYKQESVYSLVYDCNWGGTNGALVSEFFEVQHYRQVFRSVRHNLKLAALAWVHHILSTEFERKEDCKMVAKKEDHQFSLDRLWNSNSLYSCRTNHGGRKKQFLLGLLMQPTNQKKLCTRNLLFRYSNKGQHNAKDL